MRRVALISGMENDLAMPAEFLIRRVHADEWALLRQIRLAALADAPMAFGSTLVQEQTRPDDFWRERASGGATDLDRASYVAELRTGWAGTATGLIEAGGTGDRPAWVVGMWVDPSLRRRGAAQALLVAIADWALGRGADVLNLHVTETNAPAIALYQRMGFRNSGATEPLPHTPAVRENHMFCRLDDLRRG